MRTWKVDDVMTTAVVSVPPAATYRTVVDLLIGHRFSAVPVVDDQHRVRGVVSETDLLAGRYLVVRRGKRTVGAVELVR